MAMTLFLLLGLGLSSLAAFIAFLATYFEYCHHFRDRGAVLRTSLESAVVTWLFFFVLSALVSWLLPLAMDR